MLSFFGEWTQEKRDDTKLASLSTDEISKTVSNCYTKWSDFIAKDASCRCGFQISVSDITVQHLTVYFAHRGGKGNLGKKRSAEHCAKISEALTGKKLSAEHCAKISELKKGKKLSAEHRAKISEARKSTERRER